MPVHGLEHPAVLCTFGVIQVLGLISAFATRLQGAARSLRASRCVYMVCLGLVAASTVLTIGAQSCSWMTSGATFSLMVLTAVWDFGDRTGHTAW